MRDLPRARRVAKYISFVLAALWVLVLPFAACARDRSAKNAAARAQATALFAKALALSDLRAPGSPPFELRGTIDTHQHDHKKKDVTGTYLLKWASPEKWREEIHFSDYARIRVGGKGQYWQSRTTPYEVQPVLELDQAMGFLKNLHIWARPEAMTDLKSVKLHQRKVEGIKSDCVNLISNEQPYGGEYCFDSSKGTLVSVNRGRLEYSQFTPFAGKLFPGHILIKETSSAPITFTVNSIAPLESADSRDFQPAASAIAWPSCDNPDALPKIRRRAVLVYPMSERRAGIEGTVTVYAVFGTDGLLHNLTVLSAPDIGLANSAVAALKQWQYTPEICHGTPVPAEILLTVTFNL
ncbi:MAG: energy transducer TonB [Candidatus Acidiferrales bacterium]